MTATRILSPEEGSARTRQGLTGSFSLVQDSTRGRSAGTWPPWLAARLWAALVSVHKKRPGSTYKRSRFRAALLWGLLRLTQR